MNDLWIKIKFWTKTTLISVLVVYILLFIYNNSGGDTVKFWWWFKRVPETSVFTLAFTSFVAGSLVTMLVRTTFTTMKQFKKAKAARLLKEREDELLKASKLKTAAPVPSDTEV